MQASRLIEEVVAFFSDTTESYVRRRHRELLRRGESNPAIFREIRTELVAWRVRAPELSERQLRRIVYG